MRDPDQTAGYGDESLHEVPTPLDHDHVFEILDGISDDRVRATAWRLFGEERLAELETLLRCGGHFDDERFDDLESGDVRLASFSHDYGFNHLSVMRKGWYLEYVLSEDSYVTTVHSSTLPLSASEVASLLIGLGVVHAVRESFREADRDPTDLRWESDDPLIDVHLAAEADTYAAELEREREEEEAEEAEMMAAHAADAESGEDGEELRTSGDLPAGASPAHRDGGAVPAAARVVEPVGPVAGETLLPGEFLRCVFDHLSGTGEPLLRERRDHDDHCLEAWRQDDGAYDLHAEGEDSELASIESWEEMADFYGLTLPELLAALEEHGFPESGLPDPEDDPEDWPSVWPLDVADFLPDVPRGPDASPGAGELLTGLRTGFRWDPATRYPGVPADVETALEWLESLGGVDGLAATDEGRPGAPERVYWVPDALALSCLQYALDREDRRVWINVVQG
jgi:hypothetical protein